MRLTIFGATGGTGRELVQQALAAGYEVVAYARTPSKLEKRDGLTVVQGEMQEVEEAGHVFHHLLVGRADEPARAQEHRLRSTAQDPGVLGIERHNVDPFLAVMREKTDVARDSA